MAHDYTDSLRNIENQLMDIDVTLQHNLDNLVEAVQELTKEIRIAGGSDFIQGRRKAVDIIQNYETLVEWKQEELNKLLKTNGDNIESIEAKEIIQQIKVSQDNIAEIVRKQNETDNF